MSRVGAFDPNRTGANLNPLNALIPTPGNKLEEASYAWATVTQVTPSILVQLDTETSPIAAPCSTLVPIVVGERVYVQFYQRRVLILGTRQLDPNPPPPGPTSWQNWTPIISHSGAAGPDLADSIITGRYIHQSDNTVHFRMELIIGSGFTSQPGAWSLELPVAPHPSVYQLVNVHVTSSAVIGGGGEAIGGGKIEGARVNRIYYIRDQSSLYQSMRGDRGWAAGNRIMIGGTYEAAGPPQPTSGVKAWFRAKDVTSLPASSSWMDMSGSGNNGLVSGTLSRVNGSTPNGGPSIRFGGAGELALPDFLNSVGQAAAEAWVVVKADAGDQGLWAFGADTGISDSSHYPFAGQIYESFGRPTGQRVNAGPGVGLDVWRIYRVSVDASGLKVYLDGNNFLNGNAQTVTWTTTPTLGRSRAFSSGGMFFTGNIAEFLLFDHVATPGEATSITSYLKTEHGLP